MKVKHELILSLENNKLWVRATNNHAVSLKLDVTPVWDFFKGVEQNDKVNINKGLIEKFNEYVNSEPEIPLEIKRKYIVEAFLQKDLDVEISKKYAEKIVEEAVKQYRAEHNIS